MHYRYGLLNDCHHRGDLRGRGVTDQELACAVIVWSSAARGRRRCPKLESDRYETPAVIAGLLGIVVW
jgi:hypothetical protein